MGIKSKIILWLHDSSYFINALTLILPSCRWELHLVIQDSKEIWACFVEINFKKYMGSSVPEFAEAAPKPRVNNVQNQTHNN